MENGYKFKVFSDNINGNDINACSLRDYYFLSSLSAMTKHPEMIIDMFE